MASRKIQNTELANQIAGVLQKSAEPSASEAPTHIKHYRNEQQAIIRQSCLKSAVQLMESKINGKSNMQTAIQNTLEIAEIFEAWVNR
jgi:hypothetical protein